MTLIQQIDSAALEHPSYSEASSDSNSTGITSASSSENSSTDDENSSSNSSFSFIESFKESSRIFKNEMKKRYNPKKSPMGSETSIGLTFATLTESLSLSTASLSKKSFSVDTLVVGTKSEDNNGDDDEVTSLMSQERLNQKMAILSPGERTAGLLQSLASVEEENSDDDGSSTSSAEREDGSRDVSLLDTVESKDEDDLYNETEPFVDDDGDSSNSDDSEYGSLAEEALAAFNGALYRLGNCNFSDLDEDIEEEYAFTNADVSAFLSKFKIGNNNREIGAIDTPTAAERKGVIDTLFRQCG